MTLRLPVLRRRTFLLGSIGALGCAACSGAGAAAPLDDGGVPGDDAASDAGRDARVQHAPDGGADADTVVDSGAQRSDAGANVVVVGPAASFPQGTGRFFPDFQFFIIHDAGGLFAITSVCTHAGCDVDLLPSRAFQCPCHGSTFDANGKATGGPAVSPLVHYALSADASGALVVDLDRTVASTTRLAG